MFSRGLSRSRKHRRAASKWIPPFTTTHIMPIQVIQVPRTCTRRRRLHNPVCLWRLPKCFIYACVGFTSSSKYPPFFPLCPALAAPILQLFFLTVKCLFSKLTATLYPKARLSFSTSAESAVGVRRRVIHQGVVLSVVHS